MRGKRIRNTKEKNGIFIENNTGLRITGVGGLPGAFL